MDYYAAVWAFLLLLAGLICLLRSRLGGREPGWAPLGAAMLLAGLLHISFLTCWGVSYQKAFAVSSFLLITLAACFALLSARKISGIAIPDFLAAFPLGLGILLCLTIGPSITTGWFLWISSFLLLSWSLLLRSKKSKGQRPHGFYFLGFGLLLEAFLNPIHETSFMAADPASGLNNPALIKSNILWILVNTASCLLLVAGAWICFRQRRIAVLKLDKAGRRRGILLCALLVILLGAGWWWTEESAIRADHQWRIDFSHHAQLVAAAIDSQLITQLSGTRADTELPAYRMLKGHLAQIIKTEEGYRFSYLMAMKGGQVIFLVDNEPPESKDESFAGDVYTEASQALRNAFRHPGPFTEGPLKDEWGIWVSGFAQVPGISMNGLPVYLGLDHNAVDWSSKLASLREERMLVIMILGFFIGGLFMINYLTSEGKLQQAASEERLRLSLHGANLVSWEMDMPSQTLTIDQGGGQKAVWLEIPQHLSAHEFLTLVHPDDLENAKNAFSAFFQGENKMVESEFRLRQPSGRFLWVLIRGRISDRHADGEGIRAAGLILDISERKGGELDLLQSREEATRLALVAENTTSAVIIATSGGEIEWVNAGFTEITGYSSEEALGKKPGELLQGEETDPEAVERMRNALSTKSGFTETVLNYRKEGIPYWIAIECRPLFSGQGELSGYMAIETDVTRQIEAERALEAQRCRVQQINNALLALGNSYEENITNLTTLAAHVFCADMVLYSRMEKDLLMTLGRYGAPDDYPVSLPVTESYFSKVILGPEHFLSLHNLSQERIADQALAEFQTYIGQSVQLGSQVVGSLNMLFKSPFELSPDLHDCLAIIAQAFGREELLHENRRKLDALAELEATERNRFSTLLKNIDDAVLVEDPNGIITYANPSFEKIFGVAFPMIRGIASSVLLSKVAPFFISPESFLALLAESPEGKKATFHQIFETIDGRYLSRDFVPILSEGVLYGHMWHFRDITRLKRQQLFLETIADVGQLVLNTPLNSANAWMALVTLLGKKIGLDRVRVVRFQSASGALQMARVIAEWDRISGEAVYFSSGSSIVYTASELPEYWQTEFLNGRSVCESGEGIVAPFLKALGTKSLLSIPLTVEGRLWGTIGLHYIRSRYEWHEEEITLLETAASLISSRLDLQQSEKALMAAKNAADQASRAKSTFLATMSHEIRTPLNAVIGISSLLLETQLEPQQRDYATTVAASGEILLELINDILDYSKIEAGRIDVEHLPFPLVDVLVEPLEILARPIAEKNIELSYSIDTSLPPVVVGDSTRLKQVLLNLISNAVKFTERGSITVHCEPGREGFVRFIVRDSGIGMNDEVQARLFEPFMQADSSVTRKYGGTGLGLAISKRLIELMGGSITVDSKPGEGTTFAFEIPLPAGKSARRENPIQDASLVAKKVLIVDDNSANRQFLRDQLHMWGMNTREAAGSKEALALLQSDEEFALALLDYQMPELDGLTLARAIKALPHRKKLPLILLSSVIEQVPKRDAPLFSAALTKPLRTRQLMEVISAALGSGLQKSSLKELSPTQTAEIHVLVAEDNLTNQKVINMMLARLGVVPVIVENGLHALQAAKSSVFDLVLIDIQMPIMDGLEAARQMREYFGSGRRPEIIALTANAFKEDREACLLAGMDGYLVKPITLDRLRNVIERVASRARNGGSV